MDHRHSRISDEDLVHSIEQLLANESDPETRMRLLVLYRISVLLVDTIHISQVTKTEVKALQLEVSEHIKDQEKLTNRLFGGTKVIAIVFLVAQGVLGYTASAVFDQHQANTIEIHKLNDTVRKLETEVFPGRKPW